MNQEVFFTEMAAQMGNEELFKLLNAIVEEIHERFMIQAMQIAGSDELPF